MSALLIFHIFKCNFVDAIFLQISIIINQQSFEKLSYKLLQFEENIIIFIFID